MRLLINPSWWLDKWVNCCDGWETKAEEVRARHNTWWWSYDYIWTQDDTNLTQILIIISLSLSLSLSLSFKYLTVILMTQGRVGGISEVIETCQHSMLGQGHASLAIPPCGDGRNHTVLPRLLTFQLTTYSTRLSTTEWIKKVDEMRQNKPLRYAMMNRSKVAGIASGKWRCFSISILVITRKCQHWYLLLA